VFHRAVPRGQMQPMDGQRGLTPRRHMTAACSIPHRQPLRLYTRLSFFSFITLFRSFLFRPDAHRNLSLVLSITVSGCIAFAVSCIRIVSLGTPFPFHSSSKIRYLSFTSCLIYPSDARTWVTQRVAASASGSSASCSKGEAWVTGALRSPV